MYTIKLVNSTACLLLKENENSTDYMDYQFINKYQFENFMTVSDLEKEAEQLAIRNNIYNYKLDFSELQKEVI